MDENRFSAEELADLRRAKQLLEHPGWTARLANQVGGPIEQGFKMLPPGWAETVQKTTHTALLKALKLAVLTMDHTRRSRSSNVLHKVLAGTSGVIGGAFGFAALALELPVSTSLMLRSIADIARSEGHNLHAIEVKLACLEVFALGGRRKDDDAADNAYWAVRTALAKAVSDATAFLAEKGLIEEGAPAVVRLVSTIAARFGVVVSEQVAAKAVPMIGAATGSMINVLFMNHFQNMARGHFIVKRLEAKYGTPAVRAIYDSMLPHLEAPPALR